MARASAEREIEKAKGFASKLLLSKVALKLETFSLKA